jgi:hypothetical protein
MAPVNVANPVVDDRSRVIKLGLFRHSQHHAHVAALEERHVRCLEKELQPQHVTVEGGGPLQVVSSDVDLANPLDIDRGRLGAHADLPENLTLW